MLVEPQASLSPALMLGNVPLPASAITVGEFKIIADFMQRHSYGRAMDEVALEWVKVLDWGRAFIDLFGEQLNDEIVMFRDWGDKALSGFTPPRVFLCRDGNDYRLVVSTSGAQVPLEIPDGCYRLFHEDDLHLTPPGGGKAITIPIQVDLERLIQASRPGGDLPIEGFPSEGINKGDLRIFYEKMRNSAHKTFRYVEEGVSFIEEFKPGETPSCGDLWNRVISYGK